MVAVVGSPNFKYVMLITKYKSNQGRGSIYKTAKAKQHIIIWLWRQEACRKCVRRYVKCIFFKEGQQLYMVGEFICNR